MLLQVTIWLGVFPIVVSWWAALGLTVYFIATNLVLYYVKSIKHIEALWFANCANQLLFWTYIKVGHVPGWYVACLVSCVSMWNMLMLRLYVLIQCLGNALLCMRGKAVLSEEAPTNSGCLQNNVHWTCCSSCALRAQCTSRHTDVQCACCTF